MAAVRKMAKQNGYGEKVAVKVITVDKSRRRVECAMRDGAMIWAAVWETGTVFRWPEVGETWTVRKDTGVWRLDQMVQTGAAETESEAVPKTLAELAEGDTRIVGEKVHMNKISSPTVSEIEATLDHLEERIGVDGVVETETDGSTKTTVVLVEHKLGVTPANIQLTRIGSEASEILIQPIVISGSVNPTTFKMRAIGSTTMTTGQKISFYWRATTG